MRPSPPAIFRTRSPSRLPKTIAARSLPARAAIASKEDLQNFTRRYFQSHGQAMPFVIDPTGQFAREVHADYQLGERIGLTQTPTVFVVTPKKWIQVTDINQLYQAIDTALAADARPCPAAHNNLRRPAKTQR